jgi:hypothetical protein
LAFARARTSVKAAKGRRGNCGFARSGLDASTVTGDGPRAARDAGQYEHCEPLELGARHRREERTRERFVIPFELRDERLASRGKGHQRRSPVARVRLACHEPVVDECVHEPSHRSRRHLQRLGKNTLGHRATLPDLPEQMGARRRETERVVRLRHVVVEDDDELQDTIEQRFILL